MANAWNAKIFIIAGARKLLARGKQNQKLNKTGGQMTRDPNAESWGGIKRVACEVYTRVVGYLRPVSQWNKGKKAEYEVRKTFKKECKCKGLS